MEESSEKRSLHESAYRPLKEGETYTPYVPAEQIIPEVTARSVIIGIIMAAIFTLATAVSGLRAGTVFEAAIPIAILAIGIGKIFRRKNTILENVIIQSVGAASGLVVAGAIFTLPALYMLELAPGMFDVFLAALLGGVLGVLFLIPLRKYFVSDLHGQLPFPEATAVNEVLVTGERAGKQASVLVVAMLVGGIYDFLCDAVRLWNGLFTTRALGPWVRDFTEQTKMVIRVNVLAFFVGLGYIVGLRYAVIIVMGSFMSWLVLVPLFGWIVGNFPGAAIMAGAEMVEIGQLTPEIIFGSFVQRIGIGAIACAGILGIIKNFGVIVSSLGVGFKGLFGRKGEAGVEKVQRTQRDMNMTVVVGLLFASVVVLGFFFYFLTGSFYYMAIGLLIVVVISFLFTSVAARAIAIVGINPVSGMTLMTLILSSAILVWAGLSGPEGMFIALVIGGVVCTALSMSGGLITDLKVGYWLGSTPMQQQRSKIIGTIVAAALVGLAILLIHHAFGFMVENPVTGAMEPNPAMPAPQANVMRVVIITLMDPEAIIPWMLFGIGAVIALLINWVGVPALAFALGMYLPMEINTPLLLGAFVAYLLKKSSKDEAVANARMQKGTLIASGFIAGAALMKILEAVLRIIPGGEMPLDTLGHPVAAAAAVQTRVVSLLERFYYQTGTYQFTEPTGEVTNNFLLGTHEFGTFLGLIFVLLLTGWLFWSSYRAKPTE